MQSVTYPNLENICRLCLEENSATVDIFPFLSATEALKIINRVSIPMYIMACASLEVQADDDLPKRICRNCRYQLEKAYCFRKRSQASDAKLRKHIRLLNLGKVSRIFKARNNNLSATSVTAENSTIGERDASATVEEQCEHKSKEAAVDGESNDSDDDDFDNYKGDGLHDSESLTFVQIIDRERAQAEKKERDEWCRMIKEEYEEKLKKDKENFAKNCWPPLKTILESKLRKEIYNELKKTLEVDVKEQCIRKARLQLRQEVLQECREELMKSLLSEMEVFLKEKHGQQPLHIEETECVDIVAQQEMHHPEMNHINQIHILEDKPTEHIESINFELDDEATTLISDVSNLRTLQIEEVATTEKALYDGASSLEDELEHTILIKKYDENNINDINTTNRNDQEADKVDYLIYDSEIVNDECDNEQPFSHSALKILQDLDAGESDELVQIFETDYDDMCSDSNEVSHESTTAYHSNDH